jgi:hypothetical protein
MKILKLLHDKELISWYAHKTVLEYVNEMQQSELKPVFAEASQRFLYYRYGNFEASKKEWEEFCEISEKIIKINEKV